MSNDFIILIFTQMGFTENTHPSLSTMIDARFSTDNGMSKDKEDDVVSEIVEELLSSPAPNHDLPRPLEPMVASGSGTRNNASAWH
jgi:hypothetical protein